MSFVQLDADELRDMSTQKLRDYIWRFDANFVTIGDPVVPFRYAGTAVAAGGAGTGREGAAAPLYLALCYLTSNTMFVGVSAARRT